MVGKNMDEKILVIGPSWLGDMMMAQSLFKHLKLINNHIKIDVLAPSWSFPLLQCMPEIENSIELDLTHGELGFKKRYHLAKSLSRNGYTSSIVLPNSWKSALIPFIAKIPKRIGWIGEMRFGLLNDIRYLRKSIYNKMVQRYVALAYPPNYMLPQQLLFPKLVVELENIKQLKEKFFVNLSYKLNPELPILALCFGAAFGEAKCWPEEYFIKLAYLASKEFNVWILGTKQDLKINNMENIINFSGKTNLLETISLLSLVDLVVCNDSGLMHIAASLNKKIIGIYGATSEKFTPPLTEQFKILNKHLACSPCFARNCPLKHHNCMHQITVEEVFATIKDLRF